MTALRPAAQELAPTAVELEALAPHLEAFFNVLPPIISAAPAGMKATRRLLDDHLPPLLGSLDDWLGPVNAIFEVVRRYRREFTGLANLAAASQDVFFEISVLEGDALHPHRVAPYPGGHRGVPAAPRCHPHESVPLARRVHGPRRRPRFVRDPSLHAATSTPSSIPQTATDPIFQAHTDGDAAEAQPFFDRLQLFAFNNELDTNLITATGCNPQPAVDSVGSPSESSRYLHVRDLENP